VGKSVLGDCVIHRAIAVAQKKFFDPPPLTAYEPHRPRADAK
jgi:hypothetical protein